MGSLGPLHWLIVAAIVFLLFGNRLPSVMRSLGQDVTEFKKGMQSIEDDAKNRTGASNRIEAWPKRAPTREEAVHGNSDAAAR
jgi:sec-independent protein translocase protein TatA